MGDGGPARRFHERFVDERCVLEGRPGSLAADVTRRDARSRQEAASSPAAAVEELLVSVVLS